MQMRRLALASVAASVLLAAVAARTSATPGATACGTTRSIGLLAPISGQLPWLGREQRNWARLAVARWNARHRAHFDLVERDTGLDPTQASARAQQLAANPAVLGVVGPAGSDEVPAVAAAFERSKLSYVSGSATRASLTNGSNPGFFRVVPSAATQAPTDANYILSVLRAKKVLVVDDGSAYGVPLADAVQRLLKARGVAVSRDSVAPGQTNYSSTIGRIDKHGKTVVFVPWQSAARAEKLGEQMQGKGRHATIFGTDSLFSADFHVNGSLVSMFAPDPRRIGPAKPVVRDYSRRYGATWTVFGAPTYVATQVVMAAVDRACRDGRATRAEVRANVARTRLRASLLGIPVSFAKGGDLRRSRFFIYKVAGSKLVLVQ